MLKRWKGSVLYVGVIAVVLPAMGGLAGCRQSGRSNDGVEDVQIDLIVPDGVPLVVGDYPLDISLTTDDGMSIPGATIEMRGDMTHAGMVPVFGEVMPMNAEGYYSAIIEWTMAGDWIVTVTATLPDGRVATKDFPMAVESE